MRRSRYVLMALIVASTFAACSSSGWLSDGYDEDDTYYGRRSNVNFDMFYRELSPFGQWVNIPRYGQVWVTNERGFRPYYSGGYWRNSRYGYTWMSDYSWGWAPFHYGKWGYDQFYGWFWVPGYEWSPAWVDWRYNNNYYGWSPLMVNGYSRIGADPWTFIDQRYMNDGQMRDRYLRGDQYEHIYRNSQRISRPMPQSNTSINNDNFRTNDIERNNSRRIYSEPNNSRYPQRGREVIERPGRIDMNNKVERLEGGNTPPVNNNMRQPQRPANEVIRQQEERRIKPMANERPQPVERKERPVRIEQ